MELKGVNDITKEKKVAVVETTTAGSSSSSKIVINFSTSESKNPKSTEKLPTHSEELVVKNPSMKNSSKMEVFRVGAEKYLSTSGLKNIKNSEELVKYLEEKPNKTNEEKKLLAQYQAISSGVVEPLVTYKELSKIKNKENIPLLTADKYFSKTDEKYQKMSEEQKKQYCKQQILELADTVSTSSTPMEEKVIKATELFEVLNSSEISVEDYKKLSKDDQVKLYRDHQLQRMKELKELVPLKTRQKWATMKPPMSADDKLKEYAKAFLNKYDSDFVAIKDEDKKDLYISTQANSMISKFIPNWKETDPKIKEMMFSSIIGTMDVLTEANMSFDEFQEKSSSEKVKFLKYSSNGELSKMSSEEISLNLAIFDYAKKNKNTPTVKELKKFISENSDYENKDAMLNALEMRSRLFGKNAKVQDVETYKQRALEHGISAEEQIQKDFKDFGKLNAKARTKRIRDMLLKADGDEALITQIKNLVLESGFKEAKFNTILADTETHKRMACNATLNNNPKAMKAAIDMGDKIGDIKSTQVIACSAPVLMEAKAGQALGVDLANENSKYLESYTTGVNQRSDAVAYSAAVVQSENMSSAGRAVYTQSAVKTASAEQQVEYGREFSKLDYPEVTEGLAAASKYVDKSVKNQYNSYVEQAIKNYPPEQQAKIRKALETGEISSETLEKTTVATNSNKTEKSAESTGNKADSQNHAATPTTSNPIKQQGVGSDVAKAPSAANSPFRTSVTETPSVSSVTSNDRISGVNTVSDVSSSSKVSSSTNLTDSEAQELTEKAQVVLDKIEDFIKTQKASIEQHEAEKTEKAEHLSEEEIIKAIASGEISLADVKLSKEEVASLKDTITVLFEKNSVSTAYKKLVSKFGKLEDVFLRAFAENADSSTLRSFAGDFRNNTDVILRLFKYSKDNSLLAFLPKDTIVALFGKEIDGSEIPQSILWEIISEFEQKGETDKADKFRVFLKEGAGVQTTQVQTATNNTLGTGMHVAEDKSSDKTANANTNIQNQKLPKQSNKQAETTVPQPGSDSWYKDLNPKKSDVAAMLEEEKIESKKARIVEEQSNKNTILSNSRRKGKKFDKKPYWLG